MDDLQAVIEQNQGILKLRPNYVGRYYRDGGRLSAGRETNVAPVRRQSRWLPERWIASTVAACNPDPLPDEGLSLLDIPGRRIFLKDALALAGDQFQVLSKVFDPYDPIMLHFHARDEDVRKFPEHFAPNRNGKDEAYYFLAEPKGRMPYSHVGLYPGVSKRELSSAMDKGTEYALDLSPAFAQRFEEGFYVPAGIPHRPGTALTVEIQQPSDVFTHLDWFSGSERLAPEQTHPGFASLEEALDFIDWEASEDPHILERNRLVPAPIADTRQSGNGEEAWIFPPAVTSKFSGKRVRVARSFEMIEHSAYALLIWQGRGELNGRPIHAGDEFFVTSAAASISHVLTRTGPEVLEAFKFFAPVS
jgi:hypothetical protein